MKYQCILILLLNLVQTNNCFSQHLNFQSYTSAQGLSQNSVYSIAQTKDCFMWFGTQDGINRFDGSHFVHINPSLSRGLSLRKGYNALSKMITAMYADKSDFLWAGTTQELLIYNRYTNTYFLPQEIYSGFFIPGKPWVSKIYEDRHGNIFITTQNQGFFCYNKLKKKMVQWKWKEEEPSRIISTTVDDKGSLIVAAENEIYTLTGEQFEPLRLQQIYHTGKIIISDIDFINGQIWCIINGKCMMLTYSAAQKHNTISYFEKIYKGENFLTDARLIHQSDSNTVWIGSRSKGLIKTDLKRKTFENADASGAANSLKRQFILSFFTNTQNITWVGLSGGGIAKYDEQKMQFGLWRNETKPGRQSPDNMLLSVFTENGQDYYAGTLYGGLMHLSLKTGKYDYYLPPIFSSNAAGSKNIYQIIAGENNLLWLATWGGLCSFNKTSKKIITYADPEDEQTIELCTVLKLKLSHKLLTGGYRGGLRLFNLDSKKWEPCKDPENILPSKALRVRYMLELNDGNIFMSTEAQNLICYNYLTGHFTFYPQFQNLSGISRHFCIEQDNLWVATDDGLIQANLKTMQVIKFWTTENGLPNNYIYSVLPGNTGTIWISSNAGLAELDYKTGLCKKYSEDDGLQGNEFNTASSYKDKQGNLWFGGINGLNRVNLNLSKVSNNSPIPFITDISVMNMPYKSDSAIPYIHKIVLPYSQNFIGFEFQAPDFSQTENMQYAYKLTGVDSSWINAGNRNFVNYTQLNPGTYLFYTRYANNNGIWYQGQNILEIIITPPWFKTWWFYSLILLSVISGFWLFFQYRISQVRKVERMRQHISADLHDDIGASLTSISILSKISRQKSIDEGTRNAYLEKISIQANEVTESLRDIVWTINPANDKIELIIDRMKRYAGDMLETKNMSLDFKNELTNFSESLDLGTRQNFYLIFKESVNNLVKYSEAKNVIIKIYDDNHFLYLKIQDDGIGFQPIEATKGNGLRNMLLRANNLNGQIKINSSPGKGTCIELSIPL